jgi:peptidoglycan/LPS O-acetylase OafA/YrhL
MPIRLTFFDVVLFATMIVTFVIGIHQSLYYGVALNYWLFMLSTLAFLWLNKRLKAKKESAYTKQSDAGSQKKQSQKKRS